MITFETEQEFEDAVMYAVASRLEIIIESGGLPVNSLIQVSLVDNADDSIIHSDNN